MNETTKPHTTHCFHTFPNSCHKDTSHFVIHIPLPTSLLPTSSPPVTTKRYKSSSVESQKKEEELQKKNKKENKNTTCLVDPDSHANKWPCLRNYRVFYNFKTIEVWQMLMISQRVLLRLLAWKALQSKLNRSVKSENILITKANQEW